jgi:hypothetical protein
MEKASLEDKPVLPEGTGAYATSQAVGDVRSDGQVLATVNGSARKLWVWAHRNCAREFWDWARCKQVTVPSVNDLAESIAALDTVASDAVIDEQLDEAPIFLLATGWRSGSTLLQRILVTDPSVLLWGEPFGDLALQSRVTEMVSHISKLHLPKERFIQANVKSSMMATSWIATLYPPGDDFRLGLRSLFDRWLGRPARQRGFARWGLKEVRLGATEASLLHWLYPQARFLILSRHPYDCYRSLADSRWHHVYHQRPDVRVDSAAGFARHWNRLAVSWSDLPEGFPCFHVKYEDLIKGKVDFRRLESWLGINISEKIALSVSVGRTTKRQRLSWHERFIIACEAGRGMRALGYPESFS